MGTLTGVQNAAPWRAVACAGRQRKGTLKVTGGGSCELSWIQWPLAPGADAQSGVGQGWRAVAGQPSSHEGLLRRPRPWRVF